MGVEEMTTSLIIAGAIQAIILTAIGAVLVAILLK